MLTNINYRKIQSLSSRVVDRPIWAQVRALVDNELNTLPAEYWEKYGEDDDGLEWDECVGMYV